MFLPESHPGYLGIMKHRHIRVENDEWVHVHRDGPNGGGSFDWLWKIVGMVAGFVIVIEIIKEIFPYLVLGLIGWVALKAFTTSK
ncbi:MAG: hypothetical protein ACLQU4_19350 [Limisphaerales bacterium]